MSGDKSGVSLDRVSEGGGGGGVGGVGSQCCLNISLLLSCFHLFTYSLTYSLVTMM